MGGGGEMSRVLVLVCCWRGFGFAGAVEVLLLDVGRSMKVDRCAEVKVECPG